MSINTPTSSPRGTLPHIVVLATGGTIAGAGVDPVRTSNYRAGVVGVGTLVRAVPALASVASIQAEQTACVDSKDMTSTLWVTLAERVNTLLQADDVDGIVITHGTDTLEETAYLLHLTVKSAKPVVLTAAMRPSTALSADGPLNFLNAVTVAASTAASGHGVLVVFNNQIHSARDVTKISTYSSDAFSSPEVGSLGWVQDGQVAFERQVVRRHTRQSQFSITNSLPIVEIATSYAGVSGVAVDAFVAAGAKGVVISGTGSGSMHSLIQEAVERAVKQGVAVVRASRVGSGHVMRNGATSDDMLGTSAAGTLNPQKARVLMMLMLAAGVKDHAEQQWIFDTY